MRNRSSGLTIALGFLFVAAAVGLVTLMGRSTPEPQYDGKPLSLWLKEFDSWDGDSNAPVVVAIRTMGVRAIPRLLEMSQTAPNRLRSQLWWQINTSSLLKGRRKPEVLTPETMWFRADAALGCLGPEVLEYFPSLLQALTNENPSLRARATATFGAIGSRSEEVLPSLISLQSDPSSFVRGNLMLTLAEIGRKPEVCCAVLTNALTDRDSNVSKNAAFALAHFGRFGPGHRLNKK